MLRSNADARRCSYFELGLPVLYSSQNGRGVGRETQRQMKLRWRFPVAGLPLVIFVSLSMLSRSQSCAEEKQRRNLFDQVSVHTYLDSSENWKFFFLRLRHSGTKNAGFRKMVHRVEFFLANAGLLETLRYEDGDGGFAIFQSSSRLFHLACKLCRMYATSLGVEFLRALSKLRNRNKFRRCLFQVHDVTRDDSQRRLLAQHRVQMLEQRCSLSKRRRNNVLTLYVLR